MPTSRHFLKSLSAAAVLAVILASGSAAAADPGDIVDFSVVTSPLSAHGLYPQQIVSNPDGGFMAVWNDAYTPGTQSYVRAFGANGAALGDPIAVGDASGTAVALAVSGNGDYAVTWEQTVSNARHAVFQRFGANGNPKGAMVDVATLPTSSKQIGKSHFETNASPTKIAMDDNGDVAVAWTISKSDGYSCGVVGCLFGSYSAKTYVATYSADNIALKKATAVYSLPIKFFSGFSGKVYYDEILDIGMSGAGDIVITLDHASGDPQTTTAVLQSNPDLTAISPLQTLAGASSYAGLGVDSAGNFAVAWIGNGYTQMNIARFDAGGNALGTVVYTRDSSHSLRGFAMSRSGAFSAELGSSDEVDFFGNGNLVQDNHFSAQFFNADGTLDGAPVAIDHDDSDLNNIIVGAYPLGSVLVSTMDDGGRLVSAWQAMLSDRSNSAILATQISPPTAQ
jgi:hypothetical protein